MKKIDLIELDQFNNIAVSRSWNISNIKSNKLKIDFGDFWYVFDYEGKLLEKYETLKIEDDRI